MLVVRYSFSLFPDPLRYISKMPFENQPPRRRAFVKTIHPCIVLTVMLQQSYNIATAWNNRHPWR